MQRIQSSVSKFGYMAELRNKINGDVIVGTILREEEIEGKQFWVCSTKERPNSQLLFAKESFTVKRSKI